MTRETDTNARGQAADTEAWIASAWNRTAAKIARNAADIGASFPHASLGGRYNACPAHDWGAGFWPGLLWLAYRETGDAKLRETAEALERKLAETLTAYDELHHDVGFMFSLSSVAQHKLLGDADARRHGLMAANLLAGRFNVNGDFIRAWPDWNGEDHSGWAIIDCMMNLPLLYWASKELGDPRYKHIAMRHADMVLREFVRPDGSAYHIVCFDPETGERVGALAGQGYAPESAWARGAAWALHGFALSYGYTGEHRFLNAAKRVAQFFLARLPEDKVPYWDFRLPDVSGMPRDSSAAAIAASGLLELASHAGGADAEFYRSAGAAIVRSLDERYGAWEQDEQGLLLHATGYYEKNAYVDVPIIYGDYFFAEALLKLKGRTAFFW
ncbi:glycoside hydrolase family 88 protein [Paenibacillus sp. MWE-103]|uniref:Glycoside hydrolase family 88 protein n=1 Tax=Paenibacillus artemisiicola TaxID=1172618 RepID=A0ABS3W335_9BACL|nr:glycoside hydrolase family 88 protein [Paenibacillus artemisiicola]MBO7742714.1 glycoside hydrolase family 88 protein [Paenibacillus artemisiicola]